MVQYKIKDFMQICVNARLCRGFREITNDSNVEVTQTFEESFSYFTGN